MRYDMTTAASSTLSQSIFAALPIVAAAYGEKFGVKVIVGGQQAMTDGQTIVVPNVQSDRFGDALWGYLAHEAAHVRMTNFDDVRDAGTCSAFLGAMLNIFEDCRIEREMIKLYPGTARTLNAVAAYMVDQRHFETPTQDTHPARILEAYCLYFLRCKVVGQHVIEDTLVATTAVYEQVIPKGVQVRLAVLLGRAGQLKSTADALVLSREVLRMVEEEAQKEQDAQQPAPQSQPSPQDSTQPRRTRLSHRLDQVRRVVRALLAAMLMLEMLRALDQVVPALRGPIKALLRVALRVQEMRQTPAVPVSCSRSLMHEQTIISRTRQRPFGPTSTPVLIKLLLLSTYPLRLR